MRAGQLRHKVTIQTMTTSQGSMGGATNSPTTFATVYAAVEPQTGREQYDSVQMATAEISHRIRIRALAGVTAKMRVSWGSRLFDIEAVLNMEERDREMWLLCREVPSA